MSRPRVLLADDHTLVLGAIERLLTPDCEVIGVVADGRALVEAVERVKPEVVVLDIAMPLLNGLDAGRQVKKVRPSTKLVYLTMHEDADLAAEAFRAGASAYLLKRSAASELLLAIREVMNGRSYTTPLITEGMLASFVNNGGRAPALELTVRQREVLQLLAEGLSMKQAAARLNVTPRTVAFHKYRMMQQLQIRSSAELVQYAVRQHLV
jgi:DNA-binding NarL/FixJ family response regulator